MPRPPIKTAAELDEIRSDFIAGLAIARIALKYGVSKSSVAQWAKTHGWVRAPSERIAERTFVKLTQVEVGERATNDNVSDDVSGPVSGKLSNNYSVEDAIEAEAAWRAGKIRNHRAAWEKLDAIYDEAVEMVKRATTKEEIEFACKKVLGFKQLAEGLGKKQVHERQACQIDLTIKPDTALDEEKAKEKQELIDGILQLVAATSHGGTQ